jgi:peptidoglycan/LPS O-acetylase OafA/YrhL
MVAVEGSVSRNDAILPATRWVSRAVVAVLIPAFVILWWLPTDTADDWAWTIRPRMTPIFMGSGYAAGAFFFARVARGRRWHHVAAGVLSAAIFAVLMLLATLVHWDRFNHGHAPFLGAFIFHGWVIVYVASSALVGLLWLLQTFLVACLLILVGAARAWSDFDHANPLTWLFVLGLAATAAAVGVLDRRTHARLAIPRPTPTA